MKDYNTNQWLILHYPQAAGGKFLAACFMMFDNVANWLGVEASAADISNWYVKSIETSDNWYASEIDTPWVLPASRLWDKGSNLSNNELWKMFEPNPWFTSSWQQKKTIVDFWHKPDIPAWWTNAKWVSIVVDDKLLYKRLLFSKVFQYNEQEQTMVWLSQIPGLGRPAAVQNKLKYKNQWVWNNVTSIDKFYDDVVCSIDCFKWVPDIQTPNSINLTALFDIDKLLDFLLKFEHQLSDNLNIAGVKQLHKHWTDATIKLL
jgi:hypothetical protein